MNKFRAAALAAALVASPLTAHAACSAADLVGRWQMDIDLHDVGWHGQGNVQIDNVGRMTGTLRFWDNSGLPAFNVHTTEAMKIGADCRVYAGSFLLWYGGTPSAPNEPGGSYGVRPRMTRNKDAMLGGIFRNPQVEMSGAGPATFVRY